MNEIRVIQGIEGYEENGIAYLRLETVARGLGFTRIATSGNEVVRWDRVFQYLTELNVVPTSGNDEKVDYQARCPEFIPENIFYRLAMKAKNEVAEAFQSKVADEIIPTLRRTGTYSVQESKIPAGALEGAKLIFQLAGLKDNQLTLAVDKIYKKHMGYSALTTGGIHLKAESERQLLTPTEIATHFHGMTARKINDILAGAGYQYKINGKWEPLAPGMKYAVMIDTNKRYSDGTPVRQLKWDSSILTAVREELNYAI